MAEGGREGGMVMVGLRGNVITLIYGKTKQNCNHEETVTNRIGSIRSHVVCAVRNHFEIRCQELLCLDGVDLHVEALQLGHQEASCVVRETGMSRMMAILAVPLAILFGIGRWAGERKGKEKCGEVHGETHGSERVPVEEFLREFVFFLETRIQQPKRVNGRIKYRKTMIPKWVGQGSLLYSVLLLRWQAFCFGVIWAIGC